MHRLICSLVLAAITLGPRDTIYITRPHPFPSFVETFQECFQRSADWLPDGKAKEDLLASSLPLNMEDEFPTNFPSVSDYKKVIEALEPLENDKTESLANRLAGEAAQILKGFATDMMEIEEGLQKTVTAELELSEIREQKKDFRGAMYSLVKALRYRRQLDVVGKRILALRGRHEESGRPKLGEMKEAEEQARDKDDALTPALQDLAIRLLRDEVTKELIEKTNEEIDEYWQGRHNIAEKSLSLLRTDTDCRPLLAYLAVSRRGNRLADNVRAQLEHILEIRIVSRLSRLSGTALDSLDFEQERARWKTAEARAIGTAEVLKEAGKALGQYEEQLRYCAGYPRRDFSEYEQWLARQRERLRRCTPPREAPTFPPPVWFMLFAEYLSGGEIGYHEGWLQVFADIDTRQKLRAALSPLSSEDETSFHLPAVSDYQRALTALRDLDTDEGIDVDSRARRAAVQELSRYLTDVMKVEERLQGTVAAELELSEKHTRNRDYAAATCSLVRALRCRRQMNTVEAKIVALIQQYEAAGRPALTKLKGAEGQDKDKDRSSLSPALQNLAIRLLQEGLSKELATRIDDQIDADWRSRYSITEETLKHSKKDDDYRPLLEYLAVSGTSKLALRTMYAVQHRVSEDVRGAAGQPNLEFVQGNHSRRMNMIMKQQHADQEGSLEAWQELQKALDEYEKWRRDWGIEEPDSNTEGIEEEIEKALSILAPDSANE